MKRLTSLALSLMMLLALTMPTARAAETAPTPPSWIKAEEYVVIDGDPIYEAKNWAEVLAARADAESGSPMPTEGKLPLFPLVQSPGASYEKGLILLRYAANGTDRKAYAKGRTALQSVPGKLKDENSSRLVDLWWSRAMILEQYYKEPTVSFGKHLDYWLTKQGMTLAEFLDDPMMDVVTADERATLAQAVYNYRNRVELYIDGVQIVLKAKDMPPFIENGQIMVPVRMVAERLGADVSWDAKKRAARLARAGVEILLPIGEKRAYVNGKAVPLDAAAYVKDGNTVVPAGCIAQLLGQQAVWNEEQRAMDIREDKSVAQGSNLEQWALPMGAMIPAVGFASPLHFGRHRGSQVIVNYIGVTVPQSARKTLAESWGINDRKDLILTVSGLVENGHNADFLKQAVNKGTDSYTAALYKKWGETGIICWDLFRVSNLVQFGYEAGYITYAEALALLEPAAKRLQASFTSWEKAYENYLDGYGWWSGTGYAGQNVWESERGKLYQFMVNNEQIVPIFDNALFQTGVTGVPGSTAEQVLASIQ